MVISVFGVFQLSSVSGPEKPVLAVCPSLWRDPVRQRSPLKTGRMDPVESPTWFRSLVRLRIRFNLRYRRVSGQNTEVHSWLHYESSALLPTRAAMHRTNVRRYADDTELYIAVDPDDLRLRKHGNWHLPRTVFTWLFRGTCSWSWSSLSVTLRPLCGLSKKTRPLVTFKRTKAPDG